MLANIKKSGIKRLTLLEGPSNKKYTEWLRLLRIAREVRPEKEGKDEDSPKNSLVRNYTTSRIRRERL